MLSPLDALRERVGQLRPDLGRFATYSIADSVLPEKCFRRGTLIELLGGGSSFATIVARQALRDGGAIVVVDSARRFYPPAAAQLGVDLNRLIVIQPNEPDWFVNQALACSAIDAVLWWPRKVDGRTFRRWQLAAERGGGVGLLIRPVMARGSPSWADVRLVIEPRAANRWRIEVLNGRSLELTIDDEGRIHDCLHLVSGLAGAAPVARAAQP